MLSREHIMELVAQRKAEINNKDAIIAEKTSLLEAAESAKAALQGRFERLNNCTRWSEIELNTTIALGLEVWYFGHYYTCIAEHKKSLLRLPTNADYYILSD